MMQTYSENDLIRFLYHETTRVEDEGIAYQLEDSGAYNMFFRDLLKAKRLLNSLKLSPKKENVESILAASRNANFQSA